MHLEAVELVKSQRLDKKYKLNSDVVAKWNGEKKKKKKGAKIFTFISLSASHRKNHSSKKKHHIKKLLFSFPKTYKSGTFLLQFLESNSSTILGKKSHSILCHSYIPQISLNNWTPLLLLLFFSFFVLLKKGINHSETIMTSRDWFSFGNYSPFSSILGCFFVLCFGLGRRQSKTWFIEMQGEGHSSLQTIPKLHKEAPLWPNKESEKVMKKYNKTC